MRENLRCGYSYFPRDFQALSVSCISDLDFRQIMKAIGGLRGQVSALVTTVSEFSDNQAAVKELAEVRVFLKVSAETPNAVKKPHAKLLFIGKL